MKRLKQQLTESEDELAETKREHAIDMQQQGYDALSDDLNEILENTEYEIAHNADKQQSVIQSMLNNVVSMYASAYGKINEIIHNTGWVGSSDFNTNQSELGTQDGASNQVNNAGKHQSHVDATDTAHGTVTSPIDNNDSFNQKFEQEIYQDPNTDNRPVAELKLSAKSVNLEEGKSTTISAQIRPTDAKNKTLMWKSSNSNIATVSNGTIKAVKPGACQVTASTTDGSGISASISVTVTKKPDPPKPAPKPNTSNSGTGTGDGIPRVGDAVTYVSGRYYYSSSGASPTGNQMLGQTVYIGKINSRSGVKKPYALYRDKAFTRPLGWVALNQLRGYNSGARKIPKDEIALTDDTKDRKADLGSEVIITDQGAIRQLHAGDTIFSNKQVERLWELSNGIIPSITKPVNTSLHPIPSVIPDKSPHSVDIHFQNLLTITDSNITKDSVNDIKNAIKTSIPSIAKSVSDHMYRDAIKRGVRPKM